MAGFRAFVSGKAFKDTKGDSAPPKTRETKQRNKTEAKAKPGVLSNASKSSTKYRSRTVYRGARGRPFVVTKNGKRSYIYRELGNRS